MINSRKIEDLELPVAAKVRAFIEYAKAKGIDLLVTSTYRDNESQDALYAQGRTKPGPKVTNAKAGESFHNYRVAVDVVPLRNGKPVWDSSDPVWQLVGAYGKKFGLEWAGNWVSFKEYAHFQFTGGLTLADFQAGKRLGRSK